MNETNLLVKKNLMPTNGADWLEQNITLPPEVSPNNAGQLSLARQPWAREILNNVLDPATNKITLSFGAQTGKTTLLFLAYLLLLEFAPQPALLALPNDALATRVAKTRLLPLIKANAHFAEKLPKERVRIPHTIPLALMPTLYVGARSPSSLSSQPCAYVIADELAKWQSGRKDEAHPFLLAQERVKSFPLHKIFLTSTPTEKTNIFWAQYEQSTQKHFFSICPYCGAPFEYTLEAVDMEAEKIICPHCKGALNDEQRLAAMNGGFWQSTNEEHEAAHEGYLLNSLYSPFVTIREFCEKWKTAQKSILREAEIRNFFNSWLALPYTDEALKTDNKEILACIHKDIHKGELPADMLYLCLGVDPGQSATHWTACAVCADRIQVIDWGTLLAYNGEKGVSNLFDSLEYGGQKIDLCFIDSGYSTEEIYAECRKQPAGFVNPCKGSHGLGSWNKVFMKMQNLDLYTFSDYALKTALYGAHGLIASGRLILPAETDSDLVRGLSGQELIKNGYGSKSWKPVHNDHYGDAIKLCLLSSLVFAKDARQE